MVGEALNGMAGGTSEGRSHLAGECEGQKIDKDRWQQIARAPRWKCGTVDVMGIISHTLTEVWKCGCDGHHLTLLGGNIKVWMIWASSHTPGWKCGSVGVMGTTSHSRPHTPDMPSSF